MANIVFDTTTFWSADRVTGASYVDTREVETLVTIMEAALDPTNTLTFIVPDPSDVRGWVVAGELPALFKAFRDKELLQLPQIVWGATEEIDEQRLQARLYHFFNLAEHDPVSTAAFARLHTDHYVGNGWIHRVKDTRTMPIVKYERPTDDDRTLGIPPHIKAFLESQATTRSDRFLTIAKRLRVTPWQLRFAFTVLNRGGEYDAAITTEGKGAWTYATHPLRRFFRAPSQPNTGTPAPGPQQLTWGITARYIAHLLTLRNRPTSAGMIAGGIRTLHGRHDALIDATTAMLHHATPDYLGAVAAGQAKLEGPRGRAIIKLFQLIRREVVRALEITDTEAQQTENKVMGLAYIITILESLVFWGLTGNANYIGVPLTALGFVATRRDFVSPTISELITSHRVRQIEIAAVLGMHRWSCGCCGARFHPGALRCGVCHTELPGTTTDLKHTIARIAQSQTS